MADSERFIPRRIWDLTEDLSQLPWSMDHGDPDGFRAFGRLVSALCHYEFHAREQAVLDAWDRVADDPRAARRLVEELVGLLESANYVPVSMEELDEALVTESLIPLRLDVDVEDYDDLVIYRRGSRPESVQIPKWKGMRVGERTITMDDRVVVYARVKPQSYFDELGIDPKKRNLEPGHVSLRQFQNVPRADIEMLLPSTRVGFRLVDSLMIGVPAIASGVAVLVTKLLSTFGLIFLFLGAWLGIRDEQPEIDQATLIIILGGVITLGGFIVRQWTKLKNRRLEYLKTLTENLYFRTLGAGPGVLHTLLASAEQQDVAEVLLAYRFLLEKPDGMRKGELDAAVEEWLEVSGAGTIDFEVDDAIAKLGGLGIIEGDAVMRPLSLDESLAHLDARWDDLFRYGEPIGDSIPKGG
jgi:hypothetical protein